MKVSIYLREIANRTWYCHLWKAKMSHGKSKAIFTNVQRHIMVKKVYGNFTFLRLCSTASRADRSFDTCPTSSASSVARVAATSYLFAWKRGIFSSYPDIKIAHFSKNLSHTQKTTFLSSKWLLIYLKPSLHSGSTYARDLSKTKVIIYLTWESFMCQKQDSFVANLPNKERCPEKYVAVLSSAPSFLHSGACILAVGKQNPPIFALYWDKKLQFSLQVCYVDFAQL